MTVVTQEVAAALGQLGFPHQARGLARGDLTLDQAIAAVREIGDPDAQDFADAVVAGVKDKYRCHRLARWAGPTVPPAQGYE